MSGTAVLDLTVRKFYEGIARDKELVVYFSSPDRAKLKQCQVHLFKAAFSRKEFEQDDSKLDDAHIRVFKMGAGGGEFDRVADALISAMQSLNVPEDICRDARKDLEPVRPIFETGFRKHHQ